MEANILRKTMSSYFRAFLMVGALAMPFCDASAEDRPKWYVAPLLGLSQMSDIDVDARGVFGSSGTTEVSLGSAFLAGVSLGYRFTDQWSSEFAWEYRTNDSSTVLPNGRQFEEGNYASNTFSLNGKYAFSSGTRWQPFIGAGLIWVQEVDIDLESHGQEFSYSADGDVGFQLLGGASYRLSDAFELEAALRYSSISGIDLSPEEGAQGQFMNVDYKPVSAQMALKYWF